MELSKLAPAASLSGSEEKGRGCVWVIWTGLWRERGALRTHEKITGRGDGGNSKYVVRQGRAIAKSW